MSLRRVPPILQSVALVRNWLVENVPGTDSMLGYDLFLKLGNDVVAGEPLPVSKLAQGLPYPVDAIGAQLRQLEHQGLVTLSSNADDDMVVQATERLLGLLARYSRVFDAVFIVRGEVRSQQLFVQSDHAALADFGKVLYDRMYDLGWLYLHNFGSVCFLVASLVRRLAELHGHRADVVSCQVEIENQGGIFRLGGEGCAAPGQIDGHAACIIDDQLVLDFGLGSVRKAYRRDFYWGAIADVRRDGSVFARLMLPDGVTMTWKDDWQSPDSAAELARYAPYLDELAQQYVARYG